ncbi:hypothetical protein XA68_13248 [Ophiocordyceps unilateralis]|uniref:Negative acting factor n=1 Tax=Ophiocordyceps unilateralis TaxID=268505 RepID=A0A2A9PMB1_OPHUN|nr:hypothetical protein XA68_13248 [Ophiocordyceps unilateralis]
MTDPPDKALSRQRQKYRPWLSSAFPFRHHPASSNCRGDAGNFPFSPPHRFPTFTAHGVRRQALPGLPNVQNPKNQVRRDEAGLNKARGASGATIAAVSTVVETSDAHSSSSSPTSPPRETVPSVLQLPLEDLASCHFISNYVLIPRQALATTRGFLEFLVPLLKKQTLTPSFKHAFDACSLASLNNRVGCGNDFEKQALGCYTKALAATFGALRDPNLVKRDETLAAILLLGLFESITSRKGMYAWSSHIEGAIELVNARGPDQLKTKTGMDLFIAVRVQMIIHSLSTGKAPNLDINWWVDDPVSLDVSSDFQKFSSRTALLKNEVNQQLGALTRTATNTRLIKELMQKCYALDKEMVDWLQELPEGLRWTTEAWEDYNPKRDYSKADAFPGRIDLYGDLWVANLWNVTRCLRIVLASLTIRLKAWIISPADYRTTPEYATVSGICVEAIADIIASVPYQLGWFCKRKDLSVRAQLSGYACGEDDTEKSLAGFFAIWPLVCVQNQDYLTDLQRIWVKGRLKCIGNQLGVRYANMLSQLNLRMPSMLITRDRLKSNAQIVFPGAEEPKSVPNEGHQRGAAYLKVIHSQTEQLKRRAVEKPGKVDDWTVKTWLQL